MSRCLFFTSFIFSLACTSLFAQTFTSQEKNQFFQALKEGNLQFIQQNPRYDTLFHTKDTIGTPALHYATYSENVELVEYLLNNAQQPIINDCNKRRQSVLHLAVELNNADLVNLFILYHINHNVRNKNKKTALECALLFEQKNETIINNLELVNIVYNDDDIITNNNQPSSCTCHKRSLAKSIRLSTNIFENPNHSPSDCQDQTRFISRYEIMKNFLGSFSYSE